MTNPIRGLIQILEMRLFFVRNFDEKVHKSNENFEKEINLTIYEYIHSSSLSHNFWHQI